MTKHNIEARDPYYDLLSDKQFFMLVHNRPLIGEDQGVCKHIGNTAVDITVDESENPTS